MNKSHWTLVVNTLIFVHTYTYIIYRMQMIDKRESRMIHLNPLVPTEPSNDVLSAFRYISFKCTRAHVLIKPVGDYKR